MHISRRRFLSTVGQVAGMQAIPRPVGALLMPMVEAAPAPIAVASAAAIAPAAFMMMPATQIANAIQTMNKAWFGFGAAIDIFTGADVREKSLEETISSKLDETLPPLLQSVGQFRAMRSAVLSGDPQHDQRFLSTLRSIVDLKKEFYFSEIKRICDLCLADPALRDLSKQPLRFDSGFINSDEVAKHRFAYLCGTFGLKESWYKNHDVNTIEQNFLRLWMDGGEVGLLDVTGQDVAQRKNALSLAIKGFCNTAGVAEDAIEALTAFRPAFAMNMRSIGDVGYVPLQAPVEGTELFEWLEDESKLFAYIARMVGQQSNLAVDGFEQLWTDKLTPGSIDYIMQELEGVVQSRYRTYFTAAMPDVAEIALPQLKVPTEEFLQLRAQRLAQEEVAIEEPASEEVATDTVAVEAEETGTATLSPLRAVSSAIARLGEGEETPAPTPAQEEGTFATAPDPIVALQVNIPRLQSVGDEFCANSPLL